MTLNFIKFLRYKYKNYISSNIFSKGSQTEAIIEIYIKFLCNVGCLTIQSSRASEISMKKNSYQKNLMCND